MAGSDTARGMTYQQLVAVEACLRATRDARIAYVRIEGWNDVIDLEAFSAADELIWARQVKTRSEPYAWGRQDIVTLLQRWFRLNATDETLFIFTSDGQLSTSAAEIRAVIQKAASGNADRSVTDFLTETGAPGLRSLANVRLETRAGELRDRVGAACILLQELCRRPIDLPTAKERVALLFTELALLASAPDPAERSISIADVASLVDVDPPGEADAGRAVGIRVQPAPATSGMLLERTSLLETVSEALAIRHESAGRVALLGPPGFGKSVIAEQVCYRTLSQGHSYRWVALNRSPTATAGEVLTTVASALAVTGPLDGSAPSAALVIRGALQDVDLLVCDDLWSVSALRVLQAALPDGTALLITTGSQEVADAAMQSIPIGPFTTDESRDFVQQCIGPEALVDELHRATGGWPLLLNIVTRSIQRHVRAGTTSRDATRNHIEKLRQAGPAALDPTQTSDRSEAIRPAVEMALRSLDEGQARAAQQASVLDTATPIELTVVSDLWGLMQSESQGVALALAEASLAEFDVATETLRMHPVLSLALGSFLSESDKRALNARLVETWARYRGRSEAYIAHNLPQHMARAGQAYEAVRLLLDVEWARHVQGVLGTIFDLAREASSVWRWVAEDASLDPVVRFLVWITVRELTEQFSLDAGVIKAFARAHGGELTEALVRSNPEPGQRSLAHAELALFNLQTGDRAAAERNAQAAIEAARADLGTAIPDTLVVVSRLLGQGRPGWVSGLVEPLQATMSDAADEAERTVMRATVAGELLLVAPEIAVVIAADLPDRIAQAKDDPVALLESLGLEIDVVLSNLLPVLGYIDFDSAMLTLDAAQEAGVTRDELMDRGGPIVGLVLKDPERGVDELRRSLRARDQLNVPLHGIVRALTRGGQTDLALKVASEESSAPRRARLYAEVGRLLVGLDQLSAADAAFDAAASALADIWDAGDLVLNLAIVADLAGDFDSAWAHRLARQALQHLGAIADRERRIEAETYAVRVLASDQDGEIGRRLEEVVLKRSGRAALRTGRWVRVARKRASDALLGAAIDRMIPDVEDLAEVRPLLDRGGQLLSRHWEAVADRIAHGASAEFALSVAKDNHLVDGCARNPQLLVCVLSAVGDPEREEVIDRICDGVLGLNRVWAESVLRELAAFQVVSGVRGRRVVNMTLPDEETARTVRTATALAEAALAGRVDELTQQMAALYEPVTVYEGSRTALSGFARSFMRSTALSSESRIPVSLRGLVRDLVAVTSVDVQPLKHLPPTELIQWIRDIVEISDVDEPAVVVDLAKRLGMDDLGATQAVIASGRWIGRRAPEAMAAFVAAEFGVDDFLIPGALTWLEQLLGERELGPQFAARLGRHIRSLLEQRRREGLLGDDDRWIRLSSRVVVASAPTTPTRAEQFVIPVLRGPQRGDCAALLWEVVGRAPEADFASAVKEAEGITGEWVGAVSSLLGNAMGRIGLDRLAVFSNDGTLTRWPGGPSGAYEALVGAAGSLTESVGTDVVIGLVDRLRALEAALGGVMDVAMA